MLTVADIAPICALLTRLTPGQPLRSGALTCIPLLTSGLDDPDWLTLTDARDAAVVTEVDQDGVVSALSVTNRADRPLLLLDGEELVGVKQNRVLNTTVLVAARSQLTIPVVASSRAAGSAAASGSRLAMPRCMPRSGREKQPG